MIEQSEQNLAPYISLETARYLTDPLILQEYAEIQQGQMSFFDQLWKKLKFRQFVFRCGRLMLFTIFVVTMIYTITQTGRWNEIYSWILRLL